MNEEVKIPDNLEIDQALKEFETQSGVSVQASQPSKPKKVSQEPDIHFEEDKWKQSVQSPIDETPKMVKLVMKLSGGAIQEQKTAEYVLLGFALLAILVSLFLFFGGKTTQQKLTPAQLEQMKNMMPVIPINK
ncbi:MAG: hypothetical protein Q7K11_00095 [Candidatus Berkelbacteria bacterium]|nr:hypothetical protein [Candidatus Berkelbacteria bacterium]